MSRIWSTVFVLMLVIGTVVSPVKSPGRKPGMKPPVICVYSHSDHPGHGGGVNQPFCAPGR